MSLSYRSRTEPRRYSNNIKLQLIVEIEDTVRKRVDAMAELPHLSELNTTELTLICNAMKRAT